MGETHLKKERQISKLGLIKVIGDLFPEEELKTDYSLHEGIYCELVHSMLSIREVLAIDRALRQWIEEDEAVEYVGKQKGYYEYRVNGTIIKSIYPSVLQPSQVDAFTIAPYSGGFIIDFSKERQGLPLPDKLMGTYRKTMGWLKNIDLQLIADVNQAIDDKQSQSLICMAEALQEKEISDIADELVGQKRMIRVLLISGPSSSGKTTFARRMSTQLQVNGLNPVPLSLDDYFVNRKDTPKDADGHADYESFYALDLERLRKDVSELIDGRVVDTPLFDFLTGTRKAKTKSLKLGENEILVIEGIHALNPQLLTNINRKSFYKIYISSLFSLNVDMSNRVPTTEVRLLRRLIRGAQFRGNPPEETLEQWPRVRRGEDANVFAFQEEADKMFNSSLIYELNALKPFAEEALKEIPDESPHMETRDRLLNLLSFVREIPTDKIPFNSILREFIGGSIYRE
ncbi:MAG TPA: nucleoside kinase [Eubacteriaceae bacterium]|nr:nucleoside kinase [Eubacteriaceae bacterium]